MFRVIWHVFVCCLIPYMCASFGITMVKEDETLMGKRGGEVQQTRHLCLKPSACETSDFIRQDECRDVKKILTHHGKMHIGGEEWENLLNEKKRISENKQDLQCKKTNKNPEMHSGFIKFYKKSYRSIFSIRCWRLTSSTVWFGGNFKRELFHQEDTRAEILHPKLKTPVIIHAFLHTMLHSDERPHVP